MKYAFFGSPEFAAIILERLIKVGMPPALLVCNPDKPVGRKKIITPPHTKVIAERNGITVFQPNSLRFDGESNIWKSDFQILVDQPWDFFLVAAYAKIIPQSILDLPRLGTIGVHPSRLPQYRGATPIQSVILSGETETGVTLYLMDRYVDHGSILGIRNQGLETRETYTLLLNKLAVLSADLLVEMLPKFIVGKIVPQEQDHAAATFTKKFETEDGFVDLEKDDPVMIDRKVRALNPDPGVYTFVERKGSPCATAKAIGDTRSTSSGRILPASGKIRMKILETKIVDGKLQLVTTQFEGKKPKSTGFLPARLDDPSRSGGLSQE